MGRARRFALLVAALWSMVPTDALAFSKSEHLWISRRAVCVAYRTVKNFDPEDTVALGILESLAGARGGAEYGILVAYADYTSRPTRYVDSSRDGLARIRRTEAASLPADEQTARWTLSVFTEMQRNTHHFRRDALEEYSEVHRAALRESADWASEGSGSSDPRARNSLIDALAKNAYADHFLQDFLAPGHMAEESANKSHMNAARVHDMRNHQGRSFLISERALASFRDRFIGDSARPFDAQDREAERFEQCFERKDGISTNDVRAFLFPESPRLRIALLGDGHLYDGSDGVRSGQQAQALLAVFASATSILEIVEAHRARSPSVPSGEVQWHLASRSCGELEELPIDGMGKVSTRVSQGCSFVTSEEQLFFAGNSLGSYISDPPSWTDRIKWPLFGFTGNMLRVSRRSRIEIMPELVWPIGSIADTVAFEGGLGFASLVREQHDYAFGPEAHLYAHIKGIGLMASADLGYRRVRWNGDKFDEAKYGLRIGFGNGIAFGFIAVSNNHVQRGSNDSTIYGAGATLLLTTSRVFHF